MDIIFIKSTIYEYQIPTFWMPLRIQFRRNKTFFFLLIVIVMYLFPHNGWFIMVLTKADLSDTKALLKHFNIAL